MGKFSALNVLVESHAWNTNYVTIIFRYMWMIPYVLFAYIQRTACPISPLLLRTLAIIMQVTLAFLLVTSSLGTLIIHTLAHSPLPLSSMESSKSAIM